MFLLQQVSHHCTTCHVALLPAGGGNVLNVQRTVKQLINVGAKGCFLEDQRWPKRVGHMRNKEVISMEEFAGKVRRQAVLLGVCIKVKGQRVQHGGVCRNREAASGFCTGACSKCMISLPTSTS
jgi:hypothetical protein